MNTLGVLSREGIPNENMEIEKKSTINGGLDLSMLKQLVNIHFDYYKSAVNNLIIQQELPPTYGYTHYFDNLEATKNEEELNYGMKEFEKCLGYKPKVFEAPQLSLSKENAKMIKNNGIKIRGYWFNYTFN